MKQVFQMNWLYRPEAKQHVTPDGYIIKPKVSRVSWMCYWQRISAN